MIEDTKYQTELQKWNEKMEERRIAMENYNKNQEEYRDSILYGKTEKTITPEGKTKYEHYYPSFYAHTGSAIFLSALEKGYDLPDRIHNEATEAARYGDVERWKKASVDALKYMQREEEKKRKKEIKEAGEII